MKPLIFILFVGLVFPSVTALDCHNVPNQQWCNDIQQSNISDSDKSYLLSDILSDTKHYPDHEFVKDWNERISTTTPPEGIATQSRGVIRNAWVKILTAMPSVLLDNELLIPTEGEIITAYNHNIQLSQSTTSGDCKTERTLWRKTETTKVYVNDILQGTGHTVRYRVDFADKKPVIILTVYEITAVTRIKHYVWVQEGDGRRARRYCQYDRSEFKTDRVTLQDHIAAKIHNPTLQAEFHVTDQYDDTTKGEFTFSDAANVELSFQDSSFEKHQYVFSEIFNLKPLNVLVVKAEAQPSQEEKNLAFTGNEIVVKNTNECKIKISDFFQQGTLPCDLSLEQPSFRVSTDKLVYAEGERIDVKIQPIGEYTITYADQHITGNGNIELTAKHLFNRITIQSGTIIVQKYIYVKNEPPLAAGFSIAVFGTLNYALLGVIKRYWGIVHD